MRYLKVFPAALLVALAVMSAACWSTAEQKPATNGAADETVAERDGGTAEASPGTDANPPGPAPEATRRELTPTETLREFDAATIAQDPARVRRVLSRSSIEYFEKEARKQGMTFDELVRRPSRMPTVETPAMRNERIDGDTATVEAQNRLTGSFDTYPLVREDGVWKVAYDKYLKEKLDELNRATRSAPDAPSN